MDSILLVEDNTEYAAAAQRMLQGRAFNVVHARDYIESLDRLQTGGINGALIDCFFPEMIGTGKRDTGYEAVRKMAAADPRRDNTVAHAFAHISATLGVEVADFVAEKNPEARRYAPYQILEQAVRRDEANQPLGILIGEQAEALGIPFVLATSTNHHDELTQPIQNYAGRRGWKLVDCSPGSEQDKTNEAYWQRAMGELERRMGHF